MVQALPGNPYGTGFPASSPTRASGAVRGALPSRPARRRAAREGEEVEGATPLFAPRGAARTGDDICASICALFIPSFGGSLPPQRSLAGRPSSAAEVRADQPTGPDTLVAVASRAIEASVMGEGEGSGGSDGGARGALSPVGGSKGPEPLASPNVIHWVGWLPFTTRCGAGPAVPASHGARNGKAIERCRGQGRATDRSGPRLPPAR